jgi:RimJ/RimL family protein N-acetyltransferase
VPTIATARLLLRQTQLADFDAYAAMWVDPQVVRFIGGTPFSRESSWARFLRHRGMWEYLGFGYFALEDRQTGRYIGEVGFQDLRRAIEPSIEGRMEIGWIIAPDFRGRGLAEEAARAALAWAAEHGTGDRLACIINPDHAASLHIARKVGFTETGLGIYNGDPIVILDRSRAALVPGPASL